MELQFYEKTLRIRWGLPIEEKVYNEIGRLMVHVLPLIEEVKIADSEGAVLRLRLTEEQTEDIKKLRNELLYIDAWFEGEEDPEVIENERLMRWAKTLTLKKPKRSRRSGRDE